MVILRRVRLNSKVKFLIYTESKMGADKRKLLKKYGISERLLRATIRSGERLVKYMGSGANLEKNMNFRDINVIRVEVLLMYWIHNLLDRGMPITPGLAKEKATDLFNKLKEEGLYVKSKRPGWTASSGWYSRFLQRNHLSNKKASGEVMSANHEKASEFVQILKDIMDKEGYTPDTVFNIDETCISYRRNITSTICPIGQKPTPAKSYKSNITILVGANASGSYRLSPLFVGKADHPRSFPNKHGEVSFLKYDHSKSGWMVFDILNRYLSEYFYPAMKDLCENYLRVPFKILLLMDNCPCHVTKSFDMGDEVRVLFLPPRTTSLIQPA